MILSVIPTESRSLKNKLGITLSVLVVFSLLANAVIGVLWICRNFNFIPVYGDTPEYFALSKTLVVDQYRGVFYPAIIRVASILSEIFATTPQVLIYAMQLFLALIAAFSLCTLILRNRPFAKVVSLVVAISVTLNPLIAHFCMSVLTDSLAASFTVIFSAALIRACAKEATVKRFFINSLIAALTLTLLSTLRVDKLYLSIAVFLLALCALCLSRKNKSSIYKLLVGLLLLVVSVGSAIAIKNTTTVYNSQRPPLDFSSMAFNRVVWPRLTEVYPYLSDAVKSHITMADAELFDSHNNYVFPLLTRELAKADGKKTIDAVTLATIKYFPLQVATNTLFDFTKYSLPNLQFPLEAYNILPKSAGTSWTIERMEMLRPLTTKIYLIIGLIQFIAVGLLVVWFFSTQVSIYKLCKENYLTVLIILSTIFTNSALFALSSGMHAHIRYAIPTYTIIQILLASSAMLAMYRLAPGRESHAPMEAAQKSIQPTHHENLQ
ncbi:hypothetical protein [Pseudomonas sp. BE134]|uniref:hypothetical protein n=1 Tax=Pseudomonas sp. BE134 TaxID=2817843 RepID=UPI002862F3D4|nr:hypothetical protein [Pseudomonas sp. BE134]MDR6926900.1 hypothetical protein [Pseudomonas sp. BE134]